MASVRTNTSKAGETTFSVLYRHGKRQTSTTVGSLEEAENLKELIDRLGADRAFKALETDAETGITVDELAEQFFTWKAAVDKHGRPIRVGTLRTVADYRRDYENWISPWLGHRAAELVDERDVQDLVEHMNGSLAAKSVIDRHAILYSVYQFGRAKSRKLVTHNPCEETDLPSKVKKPPKGTTVPAFQRILAAAEGPKKNPDARDLIEFIGETGWRWSEAAALGSDFVEIYGDEVWVTVGQVFREVDHRQVLVPDAAKSYAAFRRIRLFPDSAATVRRRMRGLSPGALVFTNRLGNRWNQNTFLRDTWPGILKEAGLWQGAGESPTPHWLRHMHVAVLIAAGASLAEIQRRVGHESIKTTIDVYGGMIGDISDHSLDKAAALMSGAQSTPELAAASAVVTGSIVDGTIGELELVDLPGELELTEG